MDGGFIYFILDCKDVGSAAPSLLLSLCRVQTHIISLGKSMCQGIDPEMIRILELQARGEKECRRMFILY